MKLLSQIIVHRENDDAAIQLLHGDLTEIPSDHSTDILVVSAYPGSYVPIPGTLMAALYNKGIDVGEMAKDKEVDLVHELGCWLSKPLNEKQQKVFNFKRILCFEPGSTAFADVAVVRNIFRCINTFAFEEENNVVAMPVVASGNQKVPLGKMLPAILEAAYFWLEKGLPLKSIKLVLFSDDQVKESLPIFNKLKRYYKTVFEVPAKYSGEPEIEKKMKDTLSFGGAGTMEPEPSSRQAKMATGNLPPSKPDTSSAPVAKSPVKASEEAHSYDYFISYAHTHSDLIDSFVQSIKRKNDQIRIFYDKDSIPPGGLWIKQISDTIQRSRKVLIFLSPDYDISPVCWDEFQCAKLMEYKRKTSIIQTIYLYNHENEMPPIMGIYSYLDCREGDKEKLEACIPKIIA